MLIFSFALLCAGCDRPFQPPKSPAGPHEKELEDEHITADQNNDTEEDSQYPPFATDQSVTDSDLLITERLRLRLTREFFFGAKNIKIITKDGIVTLRGDVNTLQEKNVIEQVARKTRGVKAVENFLDINQE